jgi:AcrR family transcriptional regulator
VSDAIRRQATTPLGTMDRLLDAAVEELRIRGFAELTIRNVARRAGVAPATAYNYFSSKEHLFAAMQLRMVQDLPRTPDDGRPVEERLSGLLQALADGLAERPELQQAFRVALLGDDPDSNRVRDAIIDEFAERFAETCGDDLDEAGAETVLFAFVGAMLMAGMGRLPFGEIGERMATVTRLVR